MPRLAIASSLITREPFMRLEPVAYIWSNEGLDGTR